MAGRGAFWSGETLAERLPALVEPYDAGRIEGASYELSMGPEVYVSPTAARSDPQTATITSLSENAAFAVPPGQFAFLLTEEVVRVPADAMALISMKAGVKFGGLINVSGFHVDPGFYGRLVFSVFNAGPVPVQLRRNMPTFLIWYVSLDRPTEKLRSRSPQMHIPPVLIAGVTGELHSFASLATATKEGDKVLSDRLEKSERDLTDRFNRLDKELTEKVNGVTREQNYYRVLAVLLLAVIGAIAGTFVKDRVFGYIETHSPRSATLLAERCRQPGAAPDCAAAGAPK